MVEIVTTITFVFFSLQINFDFAIRNTAIDPDVLSKKWPAMKVDVLSNVKAKDRDDLLKYFNEDIGFYLCLLKLLVPANASLPSVISKLIIFSDVSRKFEGNFDCSSSICTNF